MGTGTRRIFTAVKRLRFLLMLVLFGVATAAAATVINFSYTGVPNCSPHSCTDELTGSFAFADSDTFTYADLSVTSSVTRDLTDLQSFSATLDSAQNLLTLSFKTNNFNDQIGGLEFTFASTADPSAEIVHCRDSEEKGGPSEQCGLLSTGSLITTTSVGS